MDFKRLNWKILMLVFLVAAFFLFSGHYLYNQYVLEKPLQQELRRQNLILDSSVGKNAQLVSLEILPAKMENLQTGYNLINSMVEKHYGSGNYNIELQNKSNEKLDDIWYKSQFIVYEALMTGDFRDMSLQIEKYGREADLTNCKVFIDDKAVYVQLEDGEHYLYKVIPRNTDNTAGGENK